MTFNDRKRGADQDAVGKQSGNRTVKRSRFSSFTTAPAILKAFIVLVVVLCTSVAAVTISTSSKIRSRSSGYPFVSNSRTATTIITTCQRWHPHRTSTSTILTMARMANDNDAVNPASAVPIPPIPPALSTTTASAAGSTTVTTSTTSSAPVKKGFGPPPPQPSEDELQAKGKRAAQKAKYRDIIKMAKKMPQLRKIVSSGNDEKVRDRTNTKGSGGAV